MQIENDLKKLIGMIDEVIYKIDVALNKSARENMLSNTIFNLEDDFNRVNNFLEVVNEKMNWVEPTFRLEMLRNELVRKYDLMYAKFDRLAALL